MPRSVEEIISTTELHLHTARLGLADFRGENGNERRRPGLMNAIVFGRSATFALQNLKSAVPEFDTWYTQLQLGADPLMRFFNESRVDIEHKARIPGQQMNTVHYFDGEVFARLAAAAPPFPPNFKSVALIIHDPTGGSGWQLTMPDGTKQMYYIEVPDDVATWSLNLEVPGYENVPAAEVLSLYLSRVEAIVKEARLQFITNRRRPPAAV